MAADADIADLKALQRCADAEIGGIAWPTIAISSLAVAGFAAAIASAAAGLAPLWLAALINIACFFIAYTGLHEATHRNFNGRNTSFAWLNQVYGVTLGCMMFYPLSMHDYLHLRHHAHTNDPERDPDHWMSGASPGAVAARALTLPWRYWSFAVAAKRREENGGRFFRRIAWELSPTVIAFAALVVFGQWRTALFVWFLPLLAAVALLGVCFDWIVHHPHQRQSLMGATRVLLARKGWRRRALDALLMGQNFHLIHHIYPRTPFYRYGAVFRRGEAFLRAQGATIVEIKS